MATRADSLRDWKKNYAQFTAACRAEFAFLVRARGCRCEVSVQPGEATVSFTRAADGASVSLSSEFVGEPWVVVHAGGRDTGLHRHVARLEPSYRKTWPKGTDRAAQVAYFARFLKRHFDELLGAPAAMPPRAPALKTRARPGAGALSFLESELGWDWGRLTNQNGPGTVEVVFVKAPMRLRICLARGALEAVYLHARSRVVNLDDAVTALAPLMAAQRPPDAPQRLTHYAGFLRGPGAALLAGKSSAWSRVRAPRRGQKS